MAELCQAWEAACLAAKAKGIRVIHLRFGVLLSRSGGVISRMLLPFKLSKPGRTHRLRQAGHQLDSP